MQRTNATQGKKTVEGSARHAEGISPPRELLMQILPRCNDCPTHNVTVSIEVLGGRMHDDIGTELQRLLQHRRHEGVVDDD